MIVNSSSVTAALLASGAGNYPVVGYQNLVTVSNVAASSADASYPATNLANPSTASLWLASSAVAQTLTVTLSPSTVDYLAVEQHNFGTAAIPVTLESWDGIADTTVVMLLHFDGADAATAFTDSASVPHTATAVGNAQLDTAKSKFGGASLLLDGTGDYITFPDSADWTFGSSAFSIDLWAWPNALSGTSTLFTHFTDANNHYRLTVSATGVITFFVVSASSTIVTMASSAGAIVTGAWQHIAVVRNGNVWSIYVNGISVATVTDSDAIPNFTSTFRIGADGAGANAWNGWIDEFRLSTGARWTAAFTPPTAAAPYTNLIATFTPTDDLPLILRFSSASLGAVRLTLGAGTAAAEAAVLYVGALLTLQRKVYSGHVPVTLGRVTQVESGRSESGRFLGRVITGEYRETTFALANLTPAWVRASLDPFLIAAQTDPFFVAWRPSAYPNEVGFCWVMNDPQPVGQRPNGMMSVEMQLQGIA